MINGPGNVGGKGLVSWWKSFGGGEMLERSWGNSRVISQQCYLGALNCKQSCIFQMF